MKDLNARQRAFVEHYASSGNGTAAAKAAGYSAKTAESQASALLRNPKVKGALAGLQRKLSTRRIRTVEGRAEWLADVVDGVARDVMVTPSGLVKVPPSLQERRKALELLGKMSGDYIKVVQRLPDGMTKDEVIARLRKALARLEEG